MEKKLPTGTIIKVLEKKNIPYRKSGKAFILKCPFHNDENPSASVHPQKNTFLCFVCGENIYERWKALKKSTRKETKQAVSAKQLAELLGITDKEWKEIVKTVLEEEKKYGTVKTKNLELTINSYKKTDNYHQNLWEEMKSVWDRSAIEYLENRKINAKLLHKKNEIRFLKRNTGKETDKYEKWPIMVPMYSIHGNKIVNIQLRADNPETTPRAIMVPGGKITHFGIQNLNSSTPVVFVVEGSTDYLTLKSWKVKNALGLYNASKELELEIIKKLSKVIVLFYDNDEAGIKQLIKIKNRILSVSPNKIIIPFGIKGKSKDLNDLAVNNPNAKKIIYNSIKDFLRKKLKDSYTKNTLINNFEKIIEDS